MCFEITIFFRYLNKKIKKKTNVISFICKCETAKLNTYKRYGCMNKRKASARVFFLHKQYNMTRTRETTIQYIMNF